MNLRFLRGKVVVRSFSRRKALRHPRFSVRVRGAGHLSAAGLPVFCGWSRASPLTAAASAASLRSCRWQSLSLFSGSSREVSSRARFSCVSRAEHLVFRQLRRASVPGGSAGPAGLDPSPPSAEIGSAAVTRGLPFRRPRPALARPVIPFRCRFCCCFRPPAPAGSSVSSLSVPAGLFPVTRGRSPRLHPSRPRAPRTPQHVCATVGHFSR